MMATDRMEGVTALIAGLVGGGIDRVVYLPDSTFAPVTEEIERLGTIPTLVCAREDEGIAIAAGAGLAGRLYAVLMEGSGIGYSGLILGRSRLQRAPLLVLGSHTRVFGERRDYHAATRLVGQGVLEGVGIAHAVLTPGVDLERAVREAAETARGQLEPVGLLVPPSSLGGS
jgi:sulfopyruvate decarboxylase subunit alpha